ncbi:MAG: F0F1 ATP synthase subunit gamma [Clostridiales bacterium]|nr:F0F1 ATP synthase subunit gamma [Clostridiales bacterium]
MASLRELRKRLDSVRMTGQMAGAMKTAAAAGYARFNAALARFTAYAEACDEMRDRFGDALGAAYPVTDPGAPPCFIVLGADRGLSGGYNINLYDYADAILAEAGEFRLFVAGRHAAAHFRERGIEPVSEFTLADAIRYEDAGRILEKAVDMLRAGEISSVTILWQRFVNMLTQVPDRFPLLPMQSSGSQIRGEDALFLPDRDTVLCQAAAACVGADFYARVLEAGAGSQAATLVTMRAAYDNAETSSAELSADISRLRQSEVTSSVIETSGGNLRGRPE